MLKLKPGKFYIDQDGEEWCCHRVDDGCDQSARCIRVWDEQTRSFSPDGKHGPGLFLVAESTRNPGCRTNWNRAV